MQLVCGSPRGPSAQYAYTLPRPALQFRIPRMPYTLIVGYMDPQGSGPNGQKTAFCVTLSYSSTRGMKQEEKCWYHPGYYIPGFLLVSSMGFR